MFKLLGKVVFLYVILTTQLESSQGVVSLTYIHHRMYLIKINTLFFSMWALTKMHFDAGDARKLLFMFSSQLYFYVLGPISLLGY